MNAVHDVERLIADWLVEESPGRAPDRILDSAGRVIDRTNQRRFAAEWREPMYVTMRGLVAAAVIAAVAIGGAAFLLSNSNGPGGPGTTLSPSPSASIVPTAIAAPIPPGTYATSVDVAAILADLADETTLTEEERNSIIDEIFSIRGKTTLELELVITADTFTLRQGTDGGAMFTNPVWQLSTFDADTIAVRGPAEGPPLAGYDVTWSDGSFTLTAVSPPPGPVQAFVVRISFETGRFTPVP